MDKTDIKILKQLQKEGRSSAQQLSEHVGLSAAPVWRRVKALEAAKVIQGYYAKVDRNKVGLQGCMFTQISLERHNSEERREGKECVSTCRSGWSQSH